MASRVLMNGNEALAEGAIRAGCQAYFGYPITPQNELIEYMAAKMPALGRGFVQAESEVSAISMVHGAAAAGVRAMTSSSSPGMSLMMEGLSYMAGCGLPALLVNVQRAGPGLAGIGPSQADYFQATKGGGHGDYRLIVLAPASVQEMHDHAFLGFDLSDKYRTPALILADGQLGLMMEPLELRPAQEVNVTGKGKPWAVNGPTGRPRNIIRSYWGKPDEIEDNNRTIQARLAEVEKNEVRFEQVAMDDAEVMIVAYGSSARLCQGAVNAARREGIKVGLFRPITLWPFPSAAMAQAAAKVRRLLVVELSYGQMIEDVRLAVGGRAVDFLGRTGGNMPKVNDVLEQVRRVSQGARQ
jgi:2-oxoglutarate/2-oxoacid ferredoxin oxidoreductase subunit alpha